VTPNSVVTRNPVSYRITGGGKMTKRKPPDQLQKRGRKSTFDKRFIDVAKRMAYLGATDEDLAIAFGVTIKCVIEWRAKHPQFGEASKVGKSEADVRVTRSLYQRAVGYTYRSCKIFMPAGARACDRAVR
jgi:hypothetical protein